MTAPANPSLYVYTIGAEAHTWTLDAYNSNQLCSAKETLTISPKSDWIFINSDREISVFTNDMSLGGT
jgi:hypothetical protein